MFNTILSPLVFATDDRCLAPFRTASSMNPLANLLSCLDFPLLPPGLLEGLLLLSLFHLGGSLQDGKAED